MNDWQTLYTPCGAVQAWQAQPEGDARGAVVVVQEIFGVTPHIRAVCERLAHAGLIALAPAYFDLIQPNVELPYDPAGAGRGKTLVNDLGLDCAIDVTEAAAQALQKQGHTVGVVGFCWGGTVAFLANTRLALPAVSYYGARNAPFLDEAAGAPLMFHFGARDPSIPAEVVQAHRKQQPHARTFVYPDADHAFNRDPNPPYHPDAAALAWRRTLEFFEEHLR